MVATDPPRAAHLPGQAGARGLVPDVRRIAVLRANALGDLVMTLPALEALRAAYPDAEIVLLARAWHRTLLEGRPSPVDRVVALPHPFIGDEAGPPPEPVARERLLDELRAERFDLAVQLHGGGRNSNPVVAALGARVTAGAATPDAVPLDRTTPYLLWQHEIPRQLEIVGLVGAPPVTLEPRIAVVDADHAAARRALGGAAEAASPPLVVLHPGASDPRRRWPATSFAAIGDVLAGQGLRVVLTGIAEEGPLTAEVAAAMRVTPIDLAGRLDLPGLTGLLAAARLVVSNDTGPLHLAGAVGTPSVGIFWFGNAAIAAPLLRARHRPVLAWRTACPVCGVDCLRDECHHDDSFVADITVDEVHAAAAELLGS